MIFATINSFLSNPLVQALLGAIFQYGSVKAESHVN